MLPFQGADYGIIFLPKALPLGWIIKGFQPFAVVFKSRFYQHFVPNGTF